MTVNENTENQGSSFQLSSLKNFVNQRPCLSLFILAFLVRFIYMLTLAVRPGFGVPVVDEVAYDLMAKQFAESFSFGSEPFLRPPLWPAVLGFFYLILNDALPIARFLNLVLGALSVVSAYRVGLHVFPKKTAFMGALILVFYGLLIHFNTSYLSASLVIILVLEALNFSLTARKENNWKKYLVAGVLWGLSALAWPATLLAAVPVVIDTVFRRHLILGNRLKFLCLLILGMFLAISPVTTRNYLTGDKALITTNGGLNLYLGNNEYASGVEAIHPGLGVYWTPERAHQWAESVEGRSLKHSEVSDFYLGEVLKFWKDQPGKAFELILSKLYVSLSGAEISNNADLDFIAHDNQMFRLLLFLNFGVLFPFGVIGMVLAWRNNHTARVLTLSALSFLAITTIFFVTARFRMPAVPIVALFASFSVFSFIKASTKHKVIFAVTAFIIGILINSNLTGIPRGGNLSNGYFHRGRILAQESRFPEALEAFEQALSINPKTPLVHCYMAEISLVRSDYRNAIKHFNIELENLPDSPIIQDYYFRVYRGLGIVFMKTKDYRQAVKYLRIAYEMNSNDELLRKRFLESLEQAAIDEIRVNRIVEAKEFLNEANGINPQTPRYKFYLACIEWLDGNKSKSISQARDILKAFPNYSRARDLIENKWRPENIDSIIYKIEYNRDLRQGISG